MSAVTHFPSCPQCGQADSVDSLPAAYAANRRVWTETRQTTDAHGQWVAYDETLEEHTPLGELLRPPQKPSVPVNPALAHGLRFGLALVAALACGGLALFVLGGVVWLLPDALLPPSPASLAPRLELALCLGAVCAPLWLALVVRLVQRGRRRELTLSAEYEAAQVARQQRLLPRYNDAQAWWEQLSHCRRDQLVFSADGRERFPAAELPARIHARMSSGH